MFVLANRPGFPFLGNDFFGALGDLFGCHAIDNPARIQISCCHKNYRRDFQETRSSFRIFFGPKLGTCFQ